MKRRVVIDYEFGFYLGNGDCYIVDVKDFKYFKLCNESILFTTTLDKIIASKFTFKPLPQEFNSINLNDFTNFLSGTITILSDIDFTLWNLLLAFLHADEKYSRRLKLVAKGLANYSISNALSAWKTFEIKCTNKEILEKIPPIFEHIDFFGFHDFDVIIEEKFKGQNLFIPHSILSLLSPNKIILQTKALAPHYVYNMYDISRILFVNSNEEDVIVKNERVSKVCKLLLQAGYILTKTPGEINAIYATPPPKSLLMVLKLMSVEGINYSRHEFYIASEETYFFLAISYYHWIHGAVITAIIDYQLLKLVGGKLLNEIVINEKLLYQHIFIQNPAISLEANKALLEIYAPGFFEINEYVLF